MPNNISYKKQKKICLSFCYTGSPPYLKEKKLRFCQTPKRKETSFIFQPFKNWSITKLSFFQMIFLNIKSYESTNFPYLGLYSIEFHYNPLSSLTVSKKGPCEQEYLMKLFFTTSLEVSHTK